MQLVDNYRSDPKVKELVDKYDWYLLPIVNPDGYSYTWTSVIENSSVASLQSVKYFQHITREQKNFKKSLWKIISSKA